MIRLTERLARELDGWRREGRRRLLRQTEPGSIGFVSNDYLGLSNHPNVLEAVAAGVRRGVPVGSTGSRLLSGECEEHRSAERAFAQFIGRTRTLLFGSGFAANQALLSALPGRHDLLVLDSLAHASLKEGARISFAAKRTFPHNNCDGLRTVLSDRSTFRDVFIVLEGVYSMDGDVAQLREFAEVAAEFDAHLIVDEAHATGLFGRNLRGMHENLPPEFLPFATIHPCGKALGGSGAFIAADDVVIDYLVNAARPFIFSTAPSPLVSVALECAVQLLPTMKPVAERVLATAATLRGELRRLRQWRVPEGNTPIVSVIVGENDTAVLVAEALQKRGLDVRPVRPPTVPNGTARLRISLTARHSEEDVLRLGREIVRLEEEIA